jgi:GNAT superfamily N-acetyltransferase
MRTYRQVVDHEEKIAEFVKRHLSRFSTEMPRGLWVCENDGEPEILWLVYTEPHLRVSIIVDKPETKPFMAIERLAQTFEKWASERGITKYGIVLSEADDHYAQIIERRGATEVWRANGWVEYLHTIGWEADTSDGIRLWTPPDWRPLRPLMTDFLTEHCAAGGDFLPTRNNVEFFLRKGVRAAAKGDPTFVAYDGGKPIGFCLWTGTQDAGLDLRERVLQGFGTFVIRERRKQGWSKRIREAANEQAKKKGYERIDGVALDRRGFKAAQASGAVSAGVYVRHSVKE